MLEMLHHLFGFVCGQNPDHTWTPGGCMLPFCQRCTGLYVGALVASGVHWFIRPVPTPRWLWLNGGFLILMVPFGFHWVPQGPLLRTITGLLFGFGLVAFLTLTLHSTGSCSAPTGRKEMGANRRAAFWLSLVGVGFMVPWLGAHGNALAAATLTLLGIGGAVVLIGLFMANLCLAIRGLLQRCLTRPGRTVV